MRSITLAKQIAELTLTKKADDVLIMDLRKLSPVTDFFVICSADSDVQVKAILNTVEEGMQEKGVRAWHRETSSSNWMVLDYVDVVLHVFYKHTRSYYNLEKLWGDAKMIRPVDKPPARRSAKRKTPRKQSAKVKRKVAS